MIHEPSCNSAHATAYDQHKDEIWWILWVAWLRISWIFSFCLKYSTLSHRLWQVKTFKSAQNFPAKIIIHFFVNYANMVQLFLIDTLKLLSTAITKLMKLCLANKSGPKENRTHNRFTTRLKKVHTRFRKKVYRFSPV